MKLYGLTIEAWEAKFELQDGKCAICRRSASEFKTRLHVDHNHETGAVRGLLCAKCNNLLGFLEQPALVAAAGEYLQVWADPKRREYTDA